MGDECFNVGQLTSAQSELDALGSGETAFYTNNFLTHKFFCL
jgi:hypothetical protein